MPLISILFLLSLIVDTKDLYVLMFYLFLLIYFFSVSVVFSSYFFNITVSFMVVIQIFLFQTNLIAVNVHGLMAQ